MTLTQKASDRLDARNIGHSVMGKHISLSVWNTDLSDAYDFTISSEEIIDLAKEYDQMSEDNQHQFQNQKEL